MIFYGIITKLIFSVVFYIRWNKTDLKSTNYQLNHFLTFNHSIEIVFKRFQRCEPAIHFNLISIKSSNYEFSCIVQCTCGSSHHIDMSSIDIFISIEWERFRFFLDSKGKLFAVKKKWAFGALFDILFENTSLKSKLTSPLNSLTSLPSNVHFFFVRDEKLVVSIHVK